MNFHKFLRDWSLPIAMLGGVVMYLLYTGIPLFDGTHDFVLSVISYLQPGLIFAMLFVTFCKVRVKELKPSKPPDSFYAEQFGRMQSRCSATGHLIRRLLNF